MPVTELDVVCQSENRFSLLQMSKKEWVRTMVGGEEFELLNLESPQVEKRVMEEMANGVKVYYDRRWEVTAHLTDWLAANRELVEGRRVLILGVGVGAESLLLGKFAEQVWLNDLAPIALELCARQMERNGLRNFTLLPGRYEKLDLPEVDLVVGSFLIYEAETRLAMEAYLAQSDSEVILVNESLADFKKLLEERGGEVLFENEEGMQGVKLKGVN